MKHLAIIIEDGKQVIASAKKENGHWLIGGDINTHKEVTILNVEKQAYYQLKGAVLKFSDYARDEEIETIINVYKEQKETKMDDTKKNKELKLELELEWMKIQDECNKIMRAQYRVEAKLENWKKRMKKIDSEHSNLNTKIDDLMC